MKTVIKGVAAATAGWLLVGTPALAQVVGLGTAQAGATVQYGTALAKVVSEHAGVQMRTQALASTTQYAPRVNAGELEFAIANNVEIDFALNGTGMFKGKPNPNLRLVLVLYDLPITFFASKKSGIGSIEQLAGARAPTGWSGQPLGEYLFQGFFANIGKSYDSVKAVPVTAMPRMWTLFGQGELDIALANFGSALTKDLVTQVGGVNYLSLDESPAAVARLRKQLPGSYIVKNKDAETGQIINSIGYSFAMFTSTKTPDDLVYKIVKAVWDHKANLTSMDAERRPLKMAADLGLEYHPGAVRLYKEVGAWPPK